MQETECSTRSQQKCDTVEEEECETVEEDECRTVNKAGIRNHETDRSLYLQSGILQWSEIKSALLCHKYTAQGRHLWHKGVYHRFFLYIEATFIKAQIGPSRGHFTCFEVVGAGIVRINQSELSISTIQMRVLHSLHL